MTRICSFLVVMAALGCHTSDWSGPGPANPSAMGHPGSRAAELPPHANHPAGYGWGSAYDPHPTGSKATTGRPTETGSLPPFWSTPWPGRPMGMPPKGTDLRKE